MGGVFQNPTTQWRPKSERQAAYLKSRKTDRPRNQRPEQDMQDAACEWLRITLPGVHFISDTGSGAFNSQYSKAQHSKQQSAKGLPDMTIFLARRGYHALCPELKPEGTELKMRRDGRVARVYKDHKGKIIAADPRPRKVGEWKDFFIERQATRHQELKAAGFCATFTVGLEQFKQLVCWYAEIEYVPPAENGTLF